MPELDDSATPLLDAGAFLVALMDGREIIRQHARVTYSRASEARALRRQVQAELREAGFKQRKGIIRELDHSKDAIRQLHARQRRALLETERTFIDRWEDRLLEWFAEGTEVEPDLLFPRVVPVVSEEAGALFRYATLLWSVPVSQGYGRRNRFLVLDDRTGRLVGIFALGDPVYNLTVRDAEIGWTVQQKNERLYNVLDAFVLGAVPPYRQLIGGKLIALAAISNETMDFIENKYEGSKTEIAGATKNARPVLITTTSALGRSSIYNRLRYEGNLVYRSVGETKGYGHFQFSEELFRRLCRFLESDGELPGHQFGEGPNWRFRTLRVGLNKLGLDGDLLRHGVRREVFLAPIAKNWRAFLLGDSDEATGLDLPLSRLADFYVKRWAMPRALRDNSYREVDPDSIRVSRLLDGYSAQPALPVDLPSRQLGDERLLPSYPVAMRAPSNEVADALPLGFDQED